MRILLLLFLIIFLFFLLSFNNNTFASVAQPTSYATAQVSGMDSALINNHYTNVSTHYVYIFNNSYAQTSFVITFTICAATNGCAVETVTRIIPAHSDTNVSWIMTQNVIFLLPGMYTLTATSNIIGPGMNITANGTATANVILPY